MDRWTKLEGEGRSPVSKAIGMDRGSDFECEFRARRIRVRGNFPHKLFSEIIHRRCTPMRCMPTRSTPMKYTPMRYTPMRSTPMRCMPMRIMLMRCGRAPHKHASRGRGSHRPYPLHGETLLTAYVRGLNP
jgi:hypothetical protein